MNIVVLNNNEEFIEFLQPNNLSVKETDVAGAVRYIDVTHYMEAISDAKRLFKMGNKLWVHDSSTNLKDCLYVINTNVKEDYYKENTVTFKAEDKIVELNNAPLFSQTELTAENGFTIRKVNNEDNVLVNWNALNYWFGNYFNIGIVQDCLTPALQRITLTGTMTLMELLRYIEEETGNVFRTRYEKDVVTNTIHPYLDFLNPTNVTKNWELHIEYTVYPTDDEEEEPVTLIDSEGNPIDEEIVEVPSNEMVTIEKETSPHNINPEHLKLQLIKNNTILQTWTASDIGLTNEPSDIIIQLKNVDNNITIQINSKQYPVTSSTVHSEPKGFTTISGDPSLPVTLGLDNNSLFRMYDSSTNEVVYEQKIKPLLGNIHNEILDLSYNVENIEYEIDEEDTYTAIAPILGNDNNLNRTELNEVINNWINLEINKGDIIPMIVQKVTTTEQSGFNVAGKYYSRPLNPNDQPANENDANSVDKFEYWVGTAYWSAPFNKNSGDIFVADDTITDVNYSEITTRQDTGDQRGATHYPKIGSVSTSDEDIYAIYNDVAMKLKDKRYPLIDLEVDVANLKNGNYNQYNIHDKVYLKVPGFSSIIVATVDETIKQMHNLGESTVKLSNYSINKKIIPEYSLILADNIDFEYPNSHEMHIKLEDAYGNGIPNQVISASLLKIETGAKQQTIDGVTYLIYDDSSKNTGGTATDIVYTQRTDSNGYIHLTHQYDPGKYSLEINYGGDITYEASTLTVEINVRGEKIIAVETPKTRNQTGTKDTSSIFTNSFFNTIAKKITIPKTTTKKRYYSKYGVSPDKKYLMAIGKPSASGETTKYSYKKFYKTVFKNDCPHCDAKNSLVWNMYWAGNETKSTGKNPAVGKTKSGSVEGEITCKSCGSDWSVFGKSKENRSGKPKKSLKVHKKTSSSKKTEVYTLKKGKMLYDTITVVNINPNVISTNNIFSQEVPNITIDPSTIAGISYLAKGGSKTVYEKAQQIVKNKTGLAAAKEIANWMGKHISHSDYINFHRSAATVLKKKSGDCCDQTRCMFELMDAAGVTNDYTLIYVHAHNSNGGHVFGKINGVYVDPCKRNPWGNYISKFGKPGSGHAYNGKYKGPNTTP